MCPWKPFNSQLSWFRGNDVSDTITTHLGVFRRGLVYARVVSNTAATGGDWQIIPLGRHSSTPEMICLSLNILCHRVLVSCLKQGYQGRQKCDDADGDEKDGHGVNQGKIL